MNQGDGTPARYIECMQWFLAPTRIDGSDPDPTKAPDITNNSWECLPSEGCSFDTLQAAVEAQAAAGILMCSAAQNAGPSCSTVQNPPGIYEATYSVGALNTGTDSIASFSSRGPVTADGSGRIKPDIAAPGTNTRSAVNTCDSCYSGNFSGTSMATPHIAGAMALLWNAIPSLRHQLTASRDALNNSAVHISDTQCGDAGPPNNVYGWGRVDILAAVGGVSPSPTPTATPTPTVTPSASPTPSEPPCSVIGTEPPCGSTVSTQPTDFIVDMSAPVDPATLQASDFMCNGIPANSVIYSGTITFHFDASPVVQGENTMAIPTGAFECEGSRQGVDGFSCTFTYQAPTPTPTPTPRATPRPRPTPHPRP
jgi:subtilisin family serine protease